MSIGIYKIENLINGKIYIGQSINIEKRWQQHCKPSSTKGLIGKAIQKYGKENFIFSILEEVSDISKLNDLETKYIHQFNSLVPAGYNIMVHSESEHHQFSKYDYDSFLSLIDDIKNSTLTFQEIADKYELNLSMIYYLNRGDYHVLQDEEYPLRPVRGTLLKKYYCIDCGCEVYKGSARCSSCDHKRQRKVERPSREELKALIRGTPFAQIGRLYGVCDNTIRKWCKSENLPSKLSDIKTYTDEQWKEI